MKSKSSTPQKRSGSPYSLERICHCRKRVSRLFVFLMALFMLNGCSTLKSAKLFAPWLFGMEKIAPDIHVDTNMGEHQRKQLLEAVQAARQRIHVFYGGVLSHPIIYACSSEECFQSKGGVTARAKAYGSSKLLLSPRGMTPPMITHEWSHAELYTRVGGFNRWSNIPRWFDEGLAVVVSDEPQHSEAVWLNISDDDIAIPRLSDLKTMKQWLAATRKYGDASLNPDQYKVVYVTAGHEVRQWYRKVGRDGLENLIEAIHKNRPFDQAYELERVSARTK